MTTSRNTPALPKTLTQQDFETIAAHCYDVASNIVARGKTVQSALVAGRILDNGELEVPQCGPAPTESDQDKDHLVQLMQALVQHPDLDFVVHVVEAWMLLSSEVPDGSIADHPQRQEAVVFNILTKDCQLVVLNRLHRNPSRLERGKVDFSIGCGGRLVCPPPTRN